MPGDTKLALKPSRIGRTSRRKSDEDAARVTRLVQGQCRVLEMIATGAPLRKTLEALVSVIEADRWTRSRSTARLCSI